VTHGYFGSLKFYGIWNLMLHVGLDALYVALRRPQLGAALFKSKETLLQSTEIHPGLAGHTQAV
jgi:hypothetical protein